MPAGVTWGAYLRFTAAAFISMLAGAQVVHVYYRPLDNMSDLVTEEVVRMQKELVEAMEKGEISPQKKQFPNS